MSVLELERATQLSASDVAILHSVVAQAVPKLPMATGETMVCPYGSPNQCTRIYLCKGSLMG